jgi:hypothetical protein
VSRLGRALAVGLALGLGCSGDAPPTPEEEIAAYVERFEEAAAARDVGAALDLISEDYRDAAGRDKTALKGVVLQYFLGNEAIYVLTRIRELELADPPDAARVGVAAALAGAPIADAGELETLNADLFRFDLVLAREEDGEWRARSARWRRAHLGEFL